MLSRRTGASQCVHCGGQGSVDQVVALLLTMTPRTSVMSLGRKKAPPVLARTCASTTALSGRGNVEGTTRGWSRGVV
jgi:hypothetical protein